MFKLTTFGIERSAFGEEGIGRSMFEKKSMGGVDPRPKVGGRKARPYF